MRINDRFNHIRNQILLIQPLPSANKAYSMILRVEKHIDVQALLSRKGHL